jgi:hypothetical protein
MGIFDTVKRGIGRTIDTVGSYTRLPELGISEKFGITSVGNPYDRNQVRVQGGLVKPNLTMNSSQQGGYEQTSGTADLGGMTGSSTYDPYVGQYRNDVRNKLNQLNDIYNGIFGDLGAMVNERRNKLQSEYDTSRQDLTKQYETNQGQLPWNFAARGTRYSSDYENAQTAAADQYNKGLTELRSGFDAGQADLGRFYNQTRSSFDQGRAALQGINPDAYSSSSELAGILGQLNNQASSLASQRAGMGTNAQYMNALNSISPVKTMATSALQAQLDQLAGSSIPGFAKQQIAAGLLKDAGQDPNQQAWADYFAKIGATNSPVA